MKINILKSGLATTELSFTRDGDSNVFAAFEGTPAAMVKRLTASTELSGKKVRRINLRIDAPYTRYLDTTTGHKDVRTLSVALTLNIPEESGLQQVDNTVPDGESSSDAIALAIGSLIAILTDQTVAVPATTFQAVSHPVCRASNGLSPFVGDEDYGVGSI